ncbi:insecticidal toxin complex protein TccC [Pseudomonas sp. SJZ080]|uniref:RHS repeat-associated core domain-containing protein n=1 Tax=Pseudomonas sp. SJZ080 TaxID=2572888 RepID=UPI00119B9AD0|nr:RHS repeat-associated core domain-containing protein [Pseudomonas sp. SJZ080]TWC54570.1 insecticidal toxin complex protein TccC [Pseudomonas sp. SJZ080]
MAAARWIDAHTPTLSVVDSRGLAVRNVAYCRHPLNPSLEIRITRNRFDPAGRLFASWDPRLWGTKPNLENTFDLQGRALLVKSVDAGWQLSLLDQAETTCSFWDGRGSQRHTEFDELQRPITVTEQMAGEPARVSDRFTYGAGGDELAIHNQCGQLIRHDHPVGSRRLCEYGVGGLLLSERLRFLRDLEPPDWSSAFAEAGLEDEMFETTQQYGPLGAMHRQTDAMDNVRSFAYDRAGQLLDVRLKLSGSLEEPRLLVSDIRYDALGRGVSERAGNGASTRARYAEENGRLLQLQSCDADGQTLQDFNYAYDPVGNITSIEDQAQLTRYFNNQRIDPVCCYAYDSLYQLIEATGSEVSQPSYGPALPSWQTTPLDPGRLRNYIQTFNYDAAGNLQTRHHSGTETFEMFTSPDSNRSVADKECLADGFDANGNQLELLRGQKMSWDIRNQLSRVTLVRREDGPDDTECYCYDSPGHRLRKVRLTQAASRTLRAEVRYLPGVEIHRDAATGEERHVISVEAGRSQVRALHWVTKWPRDVRNDQLRFCLSNHLNSSTLELDERGAVLSREVYYAFGGTALWAGASETEGKYKTIRYSGKERDATGLYYYGYRCYAPWLQRWVSPDPAGFVDGLNVFMMTFNNPINWVDSLGKNAVPTIAHFYWDGGNIPSLFLRNILMFKNLNSEYQVHVWTHKDSYIFDTLDDMKEGMDPVDRELAYREGHALNIASPQELFRELAEVYAGAAHIEGIYSRESNGPYKNLAAASDVVELAATYVKGGVYMDVDIAVAGPIGRLNAINGFLAHIEGPMTSNAVIAAIPESSIGEQLLDRVLYEYSDESAARFGRENFGWSQKRSAAEEGMFNRLKLTLFMSGPAMIAEFVQGRINGPAIDTSQYAVSSGMFFGNAARPEGQQLEERDMSSMLFGGYRRNIDEGGAWVKVTPGRRASVA